MDRCLLKRPEQDARDQISQEAWQPATRRASVFNYMCTQMFAEKKAGYRRVFLIHITPFFVISELSRFLKKWYALGSCVVTSLVADVCQRVVADSRDQESSW